MLACEEESADSAVEECEIEIRETFPEADGTDAWWKSGVSWHLNQVHPGPVELRVDDRVVEHTWNADRTTVSTDGGGLLRPDASHSASLTYCRGSVTLHFETSEVGLPMTAAPVEGAWTLLHSEGRIVVPEGVGAALSPYICDPTLWMVGLASTEPEVAIGVNADPPEQDVCSAEPAPRVGWEDLSGSFSSLPGFSLEGEGVQLTDGLVGCGFNANQLTFTGEFAPDGRGFVGDLVGQAAEVDWAWMMDTGWGFGSLCDALAGFGYDCVTCADGSPDCIEFHVLDIPGVPTSELPDETVWEVITRDDCHPDCAASVCNPACELHDPGAWGVEPGQAFGLDLDRGWEQPSSIQEELRGLLEHPRWDLVLASLELCAEELSFQRSVPTDACRSSKTWSLKRMVDDWHFRTVPRDVSLVTSQGEVPLLQATWEGDLVFGTGGLDHLILRGEADLRDVMLEDLEACTVANYRGEPCEPCSSDGASRCLPVEVHFPRVSAAESSLGVPDQDECHAECPTSVCNPDCELYDPGAWGVETGQVFRLGLGSAWSSPYSLQEGLRGLLEHPDWELGVASFDLCGGELDLVRSIPSDPCRDSPTWSVEAWSDAWSFQTSAHDTTLATSGGELSLSGASWEGGLRLDLGALEGLTLRGELDLRDQLIGGDQACVLAASAAEPCEPCSSDGLMACLPLEIPFARVTAGTAGSEGCDR